MDLIRENLWPKLDLTSNELVSQNHDARECRRCESGKPVGSGILVYVDHDRGFAIRPMPGQCPRP